MGTIENNGSLSLCIYTVHSTIYYRNPSFLGPCPCPDPCNLNEPQVGAVLSVLLNGENGSTSVVCSKLGLFISNFLFRGGCYMITDITLL